MKSELARVEALPPVSPGKVAGASLENRTFFDHYRICTDPDGSLIELGRSGPAINYKARDTRTESLVSLQLIPVTLVDRKKREQFESRARSVQKLDHVNVAMLRAVGTDQNYTGLVSEYVEGETAESWVTANGPMPVDAVLRISLQVVRALSAASFFGLVHRAIQPSNLVIVPGQSADGGWPFVKLVNFGLAGLDIYSSNDTDEPALALAPQFAGPEQLLNQAPDFRSDIYSLGATMYFLLTGASLTTGRTLTSRLGRLAGLRRAPRILRHLLAHTLRVNPDERPQEPVAFEAEIQDCLTTIERRQTIGRKLGISLATVVVRNPRSMRPAPIRQVWHGALAVIALLVTAVIAAALFLPEDAVPFWHHARTEEIGVPVGVPDKLAVAIAQQQSEKPVPSATAAPLAQPTPAASTSPENTPMQVASADQKTEPEPPAEKPEADSATIADRGERQESADSPKQPSSEAKDDEPAVVASSAREPETRTESPGASSSNIKRKKSVTVTTRRVLSRSPRIAHARPNNTEIIPIHTRGGRSVPARLITTLPDGRAILRLPSGRTVVATPENDEVAPPPYSRRRVIERGEMVPPPAPYQPFDSGNPYND